MLTTADLLDRLRRRLDGDGTIIVVFLASFMPLGRSLGIPAVRAAARHLAQFLEASAPAGAEVCDLSDWAYALFLPGTSVADGTGFAADLVRSAGAREFDLGDDLREPLHLAVGIVALTGDAGAASAIREAARLAEADQGRYPDDWRYPIVLPDAVAMPDP